MQRRQWLQQTAASLLPVAFASPNAWAQTWPARAIRLVVPFPPGGLIDNMARLIGPRLSQELGQPVIIDNKPGAGGNLGAGEAARAAVDGYTLVMASPPLTINPALYKKLPYQPEHIAPLGLLGRVPNVLMVNPASGITSVAELSARIKARPGQLNYASNGQGTSLHLSAELYKSKVGLFITHIPYRGAAAAMTALMANEVDMMFDNLPSALGQIQAGKLRALAVTTPQRSSALPQVPTAREAGVANLLASSWNALGVPARTPREVVERLNREVVAALNHAPTRQKLVEMNIEPAPGTPAQAQEWLASETKRWGDVIQRAGIQKQ